MSDKNQEPQTKSKIRPSTIVSKEEPRPLDEPKVGPPVDVNGDITPITRQPISAITAQKWQHMNIIQLHSQLEILEKRFFHAQQCGSEAIAMQLERGINDLKLLIIERTPKEIKLF